MSRVTNELIRLTEVKHIGFCKYRKGGVCYVNLGNVLLFELTSFHIRKEPDSSVCKILMKGDSRHLYCLSKEIENLFEIQSNLNREVPYKKSFDNLSCYNHKGD